MSYNTGRVLEWDTRADLAANGYDVFRSAGSKGAADLIAIKPGQLVFVQCKLHGLIRPAERAELLRLAAHIPGTLPVMAVRDHGVKYHLLTGHRPKDRAPWTPDLDEPAKSEARA